MKIVQQEWSISTDSKPNHSRKICQINDNMIFNKKKKKPFCHSFKDICYW